MSPQVSKSLSNGGPAGAAVAVRRIRFSAVAGPAKVRRAFQQPRPSIAVEETGQLEDLPAAKAWPEPTDALDIVLVLPGAAAKWQSFADEWLACPDQPGAEPTAEVTWGNGKVRWRAGRAFVEAHADLHDAIVATLVEFAFYEAELRTLENSLEAVEAEAPADASRAHTIRSRDRAHWRRFQERIEHCTRLRLTFARLEPKLAKGSRHLSPFGRRLMARLLTRTDMEERLTAFSDRLEACEDLYEGANDRVADYRWYIGGHRLELAIVIFLLIEVVLLGADLYFRYLEYESDPTPPPAQTAPFDPTDVD
ncbi:MAG: hypothetical protein U0793_17030 [Gemmataceae bacterium]